MTMADLDSLREAITALGEKIKALKSASPVDNDAVQVAVKELIVAKTTFADHNNGIGVDGKPYEEPLSKAEKKARAKAGPGKPEADPVSKNAEKKAAKKEAKKVMKDGSAAAAAKPAVAKLADPAPPLVMKAGSLLPLQIAINPNAPLLERPVVAMSVAVLSNTAVDLDIVSDHRCRHTMLGMENGATVVGDLAMARYLARRAGATELLPATPLNEALVDTWIDYAQSIMLIDQKQRLNAISMTLETALGTSTYLVGHCLTLADLALFAAAGFPVQENDLAETLKALPKNAFAIARWLKMIAQHPGVQEGAQLCVGIANNVEAVFDSSCAIKPLVQGMNTLEGAVAGRVVTRFPPEPSGFLHAGHGKAALLNDYYARRYMGRLLLRFDDTNPSKEKEEYQQSIVEDLGKLQIVPDSVTYTSDYLDTITDYARKMIEEGTGYMDDTPQEQMKAERAERKESKHRSQSPDEAMLKFNMMFSGSEEGSKWCLRAKIDMASDNGTMRDPVLFRQNLTPHHRTGTTYKSYPTYDLACPIVDSLEGVTHALRTTEYNDRDEQYQWILRALGLRRVRIHAFARVNFVNTVLSKRKLTWFVDNGYVTGWDDARFPTVRGVVRRGVNITALRNFMLAQGASRRVVNMDWGVFWGENKKEIDKLAKRFMAVDKVANTKLYVTNIPDSDFSFLETPYHPKDTSMGSRALRIGKTILLETPDVDGIVKGEEMVLLRWGVVRITSIGSQLEGEYVPGGDFKAAKRKLSWVAQVDQNIPAILTEFDNLISKDKLEENDNFEDYINPNTLATTDVIADSGCKMLQEHEIIQLERRGYFRVDRPFINDEKPLVLYMIPDGKAKAMSGLDGKLAHR